MLHFSQHLAAVGGYPKQQTTATQAYPQQQPTAAAYPTNPSLPGAYPSTSQNPYPPIQGGAYDPQTPPPVYPGYTQPGYAQPVPPSQVPPGPQTKGVVQPQTAVMGQFDAGARFDPNKPVTIPPPPPGVAPTSAQIAAAQGQNVVMTQRKADSLMGSDGGYTWY